MKKLLGKISAFVLMCILMVGCSCNKDKFSKASLQVGDMNATTYNVISMDVLNSKIDNKDNFVLFVYQEGCFGCQRFKPILESVIQERHLLVYAINFWELESSHELRKTLEYTPSLVIYKEGKTILKTDPDKNENYFKNKVGLLSLLDKYTYMPTLYYINKSQLDEKISDGESFVVYYSRSSCGDCSNLNRHYLKEYLSSNVSTKYFYIIETDVEGIRFNNSEYDEEQWQKFKDDYGLSNAFNELGHGVGYVPTFQYYEEGQIKDMMVYFNDGEYIEEEDKMFVNNSYYDDNPLLGQKVTYEEYEKVLEPFYNQKLKDFLDEKLQYDEFER